MSWILWLALLLLVMWFWWDGLRSKEGARKAGLLACQRAGVQFLDDTVERKKLSLRRDAGGRVQFFRIFHFEFASEGDRRYQGRIVMLGKRVREVEMDAYRI
jgi:hypothetical protein